MRRITLMGCLVGALALGACSRGDDARVEEAMKSVNVIDETNLNDIMLTVADPNEAVAYFRRTSAENPGRPELRRGLAESLVRAKRPAEAAGVWRQLAASSAATSADRVALADAQIRAGDWDGAEATLGSVPPTFESYERYRLAAMIADSKKQWTRADAFYETAAGLTTTPSGVLNNWGYSKLTRGDYAAAESMFAEAITYDGALFTAKNNLALARGAQRNYTLPVVPMTQAERAKLLHTLALSAIKQGDVATGEGLLREALDTHPQHFEAAARSLAALDG